jgi:hypothetical protein
MSTRLAGGLAMTSDDDANECDLGEVRAELGASNLSFEPPKGTSGALIFTPNGHKCALSVVTSQTDKVTRFELHDLPRLPLLRPLTWVSQPGGKVYRLRVVRTISVAWIALGFVPLFFYFRHFIPALGNVTTVILSVMPWLVPFLAEHLTPLKGLKLRLGRVFLFNLLPVVPYVLLIAIKPHEAVVSQDDARIIDGSVQAPGAIQFVSRSREIEREKSTGCAWTNDEHKGCRSLTPFLGWPDRVLDALDAHLGTPITRLRCQSDVARLRGISSSPNPDVPCLRAEDVSLRTGASASPGLCTVAVQEAAGDCGPVRSVRDAWLAFPGFLAMARLVAAPGLKAHLDCAPDGCTTASASASDAAPSTGGDTVGWEPGEVWAVELSDLCIDDSDSVCAVRSNRQLSSPGKLVGVPLPRQVPFRITAALVGASQESNAKAPGPVAEAICTLRDPRAATLRLALLEDSRWIKSVSVSSKDGDLIVRCAPTGDATTFAALVPENGAHRLEIAASDTPSSQTILPIDGTLVIRQREGEKEWRIDSRGQPAFVRAARLDCPATAKVDVRTPEYCSSGSSAAGKLESLFVVAQQPTTGLELSVDASDPKHCSLPPAPPGALGSLPFVLHCAKGKSADGFGRYKGAEEKLAWCPPSELACDF